MDAIGQGFFKSFKRQLSTVGNGNYTTFEKLKFIKMNKTNFVSYRKHIVWKFNNHFNNSLTSLIVVSCKAK